MEEDVEKVDVAINIFAKPFQTALAILSLLDKCGRHVGTLWLQYEPVGCKLDTLNPYAIVEYLVKKGIACQLSQPKRWLARKALTNDRLQSPEERSCIRYEHAFERSTRRLLFIMHNDIFVLRDLLGKMKENLGDAFALGQVGQCWNCPAANAGIMRDVLGQRPCTPDTYQEFRPTHEHLCRLYAEAHARGVFARPYDSDHFRGEFERQPWPLPECRVNEWACLINLHKVRPLSVPCGEAWPPGAYRPCGECNLDIGTPFFRDLHAKGLYARHFNLHTYIDHWVGTGNNTPARYAYSEDRAKSLLKKYYPDYTAWLAANGEKI